MREAADEAGGGVRSAALTLPGFVHDVCSGVHPLARASVAFEGIEVEWVQPGLPAAHPLDDGTAVVLHRSLEETASALGQDAAAYRRLIGPFVGAWLDIARLRPVASLRRLGLAPLHAALSQAAALARRRFTGEPARALFAGNAAHSMLPLERRPSAGFAVALLTMGHTVGWPFPRGGRQG